MAAARIVLQIMTERDPRLKPARPRSVLPPMRIEEGPPVITRSPRSEYVLTDLDEGNGEHVYRLRRTG
ncbi:hypothetical protein CFP66_21620 [Pseudonocardia sp. MH-G8]|nr:hypothetical protein CFP66_21620 [Pseudonocardia sp. MH-G8]